MSIAPIFSLLSAASPVTAIVGTNPVRVYGAGNIPEVSGQEANALIPCVTWQSIGGTPENVLDDRPPTDNLRVQIDCWALTLLAAEGLATVVQAALELSGHCVSFNGSDYDPDTKRYRVSFDHSFWLAH